MDSGPTCRGLQAKHGCAVRVPSSLLCPFWKMGVQVSQPKLWMGSKHLPAQGTPTSLLSSPVPASPPFPLPPAETPAPNSSGTFFSCTDQALPRGHLVPSMRKAGQATGWAKRCLLGVALSEQGVRGAGGSRVVWDGAAAEVGCRARSLTACPSRAGLVAQPSGTTVPGQREAGGGFW